MKGTKLNPWFLRQNCDFCGIIYNVPKIKKNSWKFYKNVLQRLPIAFRYKLMCLPLYRKMVRLIIFCSKLVNFGFDKYTNSNKQTLAY